MKSNIVLIGMPGSGKSTIGRILGNMLNRDSIDGDAIIEYAEGRKLQDIIDQDGNDYFKEVENRVLSSLKYENYVISPGGSAVYYPEAMAHLKEIAEIVYLKVSFPILSGRVHNLASRGIVFAEGQTFEDLYNERTPYYEKYAEYTIVTDFQTPAETAKAVIEALSSK